MINMQKINDITFRLNTSRQNLVSLLACSLHLGFVNEDIEWIIQFRITDENQIVNGHYFLNLCRQINRQLLAQPVEHIQFFNSCLLAHTPRTPQTSCPQITVDGGGFYDSNVRSV